MSLTGSRLSLQVSSPYTLTVPRLCSLPNLIPGIQHTQCSDHSAVQVNLSTSSLALICMFVVIVVCLLVLHSLAIFSVCSYSTLYPSQCHRSHRYRSTSVSASSYHACLKLLVAFSVSVMVSLLLAASSSSSTLLDLHLLCLPVFHVSSHHSCKVPTQSSKFISSYRFNLW